MRENTELESTLIDQLRLQIDEIHRAVLAAQAGKARGDRPRELQALESRLRRELKRRERDLRDRRATQGD